MLYRETYNSKIGPIYLISDGVYLTGLYFKGSRDDILHKDTYILNKNLKILLLDRGKFAHHRVCPMNKFGIKCQNCTPCGILSGFGGAGTFSDGKLNFVPKLGKSDLYKYMSEDDALNLLDDTEKIFNEFKMDSDIYPSNMDEALKIKKDVAKTGARLLLIKQKHLGSDKLPEYIKFSKYFFSIIY